ncbi:MAG: hypothetical protein ACFB0B_14765 [Thermonemataceae bacterium]
MHTIHKTSRRIVFFSIMWLTMLSCQDARQDFIKPSPVALEAIEVGATSFIARWEPVEGAVDYLLDVSESPNFNDYVESYQARVVEGTAFLVVGVEVNRTYYYRVRSRRENNISDNSNVIEATTQNFIAAPFITNVTDRTAIRFTTNWEEVTDATSYLVDVATDAAFENILTDYDGREVLGGDTEINGLDFRETYYVRLRSKRLEIVSEYSNTLEVTPLITPSCKVGRIDFNTLGGSQIFTYGSRGQLATIRNEGDFGTPDFNNTTWNISYNGSGNITNAQLIDDESNVLRVYNYAYQNGRVSAIRYTVPTEGLQRVWRFTYAGDRLVQWSAFSDLLQTNLIESYTYAYNDRGDIVEARDQNGDLYSQFGYDDFLSPYALFDPDVALLVFGSIIDEPRPFLPEHNIVEEEIRLNSANSEREVYLFDYNEEEIAVEQRGFYSLEFTFQGCDF